MKIAGIVLLTIGILSVSGAFIGAANGRDLNLSGLTFVVLGAFLLSRANKKKEEEERKVRWENEESKKE